MAQGIFTLKQVNQAIRQGAWPNSAPKFVEYLVVAGGGGGGTGDAGGGGAGGLLTSMVPVTAGASYFVTVGSGGAGSTAASGYGSNGANSVFDATSSSASTGRIVCIGGGAGAGEVNTGAPNNGNSGGSGGGGAGGSTYGTGGAGVLGQGNKAGDVSTQPSAGYGGSGGGGAGTAGFNTTGGSLGNGGAGIASAISGAVTTYAGGGGGGNRSSGSPSGIGGVGGGGAGGFGLANGTSGTVNTGGGGGGAGNDYESGYSGGTGGSGIVVVRYSGNIVFYTGGTVNYNNGYISHIFNATGTLAPTTPTPYDTSYQISRSLRFNKADNPNLSRTVGGSGNRRTFTFSAWIKRTATNTSNVETPVIFLASDLASGSAYLTFGRYGADIDSLSFAEQSGNSITTTSAVFRDLSAWYHIVLAVDTTQATSSNRVKIYVNGTLQDITAGSTYPPQNTDTYINYSPFTHKLGAYSSAGDGYQFNGYMAEVNFIDGQQLTPSSFGATSTTTGVWAPIKYTGTYGTNGFYLNFSDNTNTTATTLGADSSGNGNNWTPNNFSVTAGAGNDSMVDTPTPYGFDTGVGGEVRGNYCTWNPLSARTTTLTNGNLDGSTTSGMVAGTIGVSSGKWYWECTPTDTTTQQVFGIMSVFNTSFPTYPGGSADSYGYYGTTGNKYNNNSNVGYGATFTNNDVIGVALDLDAGTLTFYKNNTSQGVAYSGLSGTFMPAAGDGATNAWTANFGQRPFAYTAPSGFKALCTQNLPEPAIGGTSETLANEFFNTVTYTGAGGSQSITGVGFQPDFVWMKGRSLTSGHILQNVLSGVTKGLQTEVTSSEFTDATTLTAFNSDGFTVGGNSQTNSSGQTYVAWNWRAGNNAGTSNRDGTIASTVSVNQRSGFSIATLTYSGAGTVGHGLGVAPQMIIVKSRAGSGNWFVAHIGLTNMSGYYILLNSTNSEGAASWGGSPTSTTFNMSNNIFGSDTYVAYCFAPVSGYSAFGKYTGNGSADGPFVHTGFRPRFIFIKSSSRVEDWHIMDTSRSTYNKIDADLYPNTTGAEGANNGTDILSNGFKLRSTDSGTNFSAATYIYMAFAENPFKYSLAR